MKLHIEEIKKIVDKRGYFVLKGNHFGDDPIKYGMNFSSNFGELLEQNIDGKYFSYIQPTGDYKSPLKGATNLKLHTDRFYAKKYYKPKYVLMFCLRSNPESGGLGIISDISSAINSVENKNNILNTQIGLKDNDFYFGSIKIKIYQSHIAPMIESGILYEDGIYSISDDMYMDESLKLFAEALEKNSVALDPYEIGDIIIMNNLKFAHGRTKILDN